MGKDVGWAVPTDDSTVERGFKSLPLPPGEGRGEGILVNGTHLTVPHPNPLPKGEGICRREWLTGWLRYAALAGISIFSAAMLVRRASAPGDSACGVAFGCRQCSELAGCGRPEAVRIKQQG
jgi:hypothetical protein